MANDDHLDKRGNPKNGWYCTQCETKMPDEIVNSYPASIDPRYKNVTCSKCKKMKVVRFYAPKTSDQSLQK